MDCTEIGWKTIVRGFPERQAMPRKKAFNGMCPRPHRKDALAQCRIGFQPVSPDHGTNRSAIRIAKVYRPKEDELSREGSSCRPWRQAGSTFFRAFTQRANGKVAP
jgi:hypothetical protein